MAVTVASRRLIGSCNRDCDYEVVKNLMFELEKVFDDFCNINEEYEIIVAEEKYSEHRVVNGEDTTTYRDNVKQCYMEARDVYVNVKATNEQVARKQATSPVRVAIKNDICRIQELITLVDQNLESDNINLDALQPDKSELQLILNQICENMAKLWSIGCLEESNAIQDNVDNITGTVYNRIRKINFVLHNHQTSKSSNPRKPLTDVDSNNSPPASSDSTSEDNTSHIISADAPTENTQTEPTTTSAATPADDNTASSLPIMVSIPAVSTAIPSSAYTQTTPHQHSSILPESTYDVPQNYSIPNTILSPMSTTTSTINYHRSLYTYTNTPISTAVHSAPFTTPSSFHQHPCFHQYPRFHQHPCLHRSPLSCHDSTPWKPVNLPATRYLRSQFQSTQQHLYHAYSSHCTLCTTSNACIDTSSKHGA